MSRRTTLVAAEKRGQHHHRLVVVLTFVVLLLLSCGDAFGDEQDDDDDAVVAVAATPTAATTTTTKISGDAPGENDVLTSPMILMGQTVEGALNGLVNLGKLTTAQSETIAAYVLMKTTTTTTTTTDGRDPKKKKGRNDADALAAAPPLPPNGARNHGQPLADETLIPYLDAEVDAGRMDADTAYYVRNMLNLLRRQDDPERGVRARAGAGIGDDDDDARRRRRRDGGVQRGRTRTPQNTGIRAGGEGRDRGNRGGDPRSGRRSQGGSRNSVKSLETNIAELEGIWLAPELDAGGNGAFTGDIHNGIWGYADSSNGREYALACTSAGLNVVDVTIPSSMVRVQFIPMPGGTFWRDVVTYLDESTGVTYAYVAGQNGADLWIVKLSALSSNVLPIGPGHAEDSDPIPPTDYKLEAGYANYGHTIHAQDGLLFLNTAIVDVGVQILDLRTDPWNPVRIAFWNGGDGHDVAYSENRKHLYASDGYTSNWSTIDLSDVRDLYYNQNGGVDDPVNLNDAGRLVAQSRIAQASYAHSSTLTEDGTHMYVFDEFNVVDDIGIYDVTDPTNMVYRGRFAWSGKKGRKDALPHNGHVRGNLLHVAYYAAGYRVFDVGGDPTEPVEVGGYDTSDLGKWFPETQNLESEGAWNLYADLPSGNVLVSDMGTGLHVFSIAR